MLFLLLLYISQNVWRCFDLIVHWKCLTEYSFHVICLYRFDVCACLSIFSMILPLRILRKFLLSTCLVIAFSCMRLMVVSFPLCKMGMSPFSICLVGVVVVAFLLSEQRERKKEGIRIDEKYRGELYFDNKK